MGQKGVGFRVFGPKTNILDNSLTVFQGRVSIAISNRNKKEKSYAEADFNHVT